MLLILFSIKPNYWETVAQPAPNNKNGILKKGNNCVPCGTSSFLKQTRKYK